ncbi:hypothetical protein CP532_4009 [Ophiocordyceps camponoti-leonardi (nom. inval.)]|nr:hypothetical protein CP532_4009 [Ophiocordyceps camponoti-leonardi (nom. inval.)]
MRFSAFTLTAMLVGLASSSPAAAPPAGHCCCCNPGTSPSEARIVCSAMTSRDAGCFCAQVVCPEEAKTVYERGPEPTST